MEQGNDTVEDVNTTTSTAGKPNKMSEVKGDENNEARDEKNGKKEPAVAERNAEARAARVERRRKSRETSIQNSDKRSRSVDRSRPASPKRTKSEEKAVKEQEKKGDGKHAKTGDAKTKDKDAKVHDKLRNDEKNLDDKESHGKHAVEGSKSKHRNASSNHKPEKVSEKYPASKKDKESTDRKQEKHGKVDSEKTASRNEESKSNDEKKIEKAQVKSQIVEKSARSTDAKSPDPVKPVSRVTRPNMPPVPAKPKFSFEEQLTILDRLPFAKKGESPTVKEKVLNGHNESKSSTSSTSSPEQAESNKKMNETPAMELTSPRSRLKLQKKKAENEHQQDGKRQKLDAAEKKAEASEKKVATAEKMEAVKKTVSSATKPTEQPATLISEKAEAAKSHAGKETSKVNGELSNKLEFQVSPRSKLKLARRTPQNVVGKLQIQSLSEPIREKEPVQKPPDPPADVRPPADSTKDKVAKTIDETIETIVSKGGVEPDSLVHEKLSKGNEQKQLNSKDTVTKSNLPQDSQSESRPADSTLQPEPQELQTMVSESQPARPESQPSHPESELSHSGSQPPRPELQAPHVESHPARLQARSPRRESRTPRQESQPAQLPPQTATSSSSSTLGDSNAEDDGKVSSSKEAPDIPCEWIPGDLVWARLTGYPWWPGLIADDPILNVHTQVQELKRTWTRTYHVQFLGKAVLRGWLRASALMTYEGVEKYKEQVDHLAKSLTRKSAARTKILSSYIVKPFQRKAWDGSVEEAELALPLPRDERQLRFGVDYIMDDGPKTKKRHRSSSKTEGSSPKRKKLNTTVAESSPKSPKSPKKTAKSAEDKIKTPKSSKKAINTAEESSSKSPKKAVKTAEETSAKSPIKAMKAAEESSTEALNTHKDDEKDTLQGKATERIQRMLSPPSSSSSSSSSQQALQKNKRTDYSRVGKTQGNFFVFLQKQKQQVMEEHPDMDSLSVEFYLRQQWEHMSDQQQARYRSRFGSKVDSTKTAVIRLTPLEESTRTPPKRVHKPSLKFLEADVNSMYHSAAQAEEKPRKGNKNSVGNGRPRRSAREKKEQPTEVKTTDTVTAVEQAEVAPVVETEHKNEATSEEKAQNEKQVSEAVADSTANESISTAVTPVANGTRVSEGKLDKVCQLCHKPSELFQDLVKCDGVCCSFFHLTCVGFSSMPTEGYKCPECTSGIHSCFVCKESSPDTRRCCVPMCGKFYHESCLKKYPQPRVESKGFTCPLHFCLPCASLAPRNSGSGKGRLIRCILCPTAYHNSDACVGAGTVTVTNGNMVCPAHYKYTGRGKPPKHVNVNWCFLCSSGGSLVCCESCPAAFHIDCLGSEPPEGSFYCSECVAGRQPKYGDIVWVKLGLYRWWPAEICHAKDIPDNIQAIPHHYGEFPIKFFGSHDYYWTNRSRVFLYQEGDKNTKTHGGNGKSIGRVFDLALTEAAEAFDVLKNARETREALEKERNSLKPPPFKQIKVILHRL